MIERFLKELWDFIWWPALLVGIGVHWLFIAVSGGPEALTFDTMALAALGTTAGYLGFSAVFIGGIVTRAPKTDRRP